MHKKHAILLLLIAVSAALRFYGISLYSLNGDEYNTIAEAKSIGLNWNSILYFVVMHLWAQFGASELWLRLPAAMFGVATVFIFYKLGGRLGGYRFSVIAGLLAATSPFHIYHSQEARFYSFFIFASATFMLATVHYVETKNSQQRSLPLVILSGALLVLSHFLGVLAACTQIGATFVAMNSKLSKRLRAVGVLVLLVGLFLTPFLPGVHQELWRFYREHANASAASVPLITQISVLNAMKLAWTVYVFTFGYHLYPFWLVVVIPGALLVFLLLLFGGVRMMERSPWGILPLIYLAVLMGVYFSLEPVGGRLASGVAPRHVAFLWPAYVLLIAVGLSALRKSGLVYIATITMIFINLSSLWPRWTRAWSYSTMTDYRGVADFAAAFIDPHTIIVHDGRSDGPIAFYFPQQVPRINYWPYLQRDSLADLTRYHRLVLVMNDYRPWHRQNFNQLLQHLDEAFTWVDVRVDYPFFTYILERKPQSRVAYTVVPETGQIRQPFSIYGLEFQDLRLPVTLRVKDVPLVVAGSFDLPDLDGHHERVIPLTNASQSDRLVLLSNVVATEGLEPGQQIAEVLLESGAGKIWSFPLRLGVETESWASTCLPDAPCKTSYRWHKRIAFVGQLQYPGAWSDFQAGLHGVVIKLPQPAGFTRITLRYLANKGHLYVWGLALPPCATVAIQQGMSAYLRNGAQIAESQSLIEPRSYADVR